MKVTKEKKAKGSERMIMIMTVSPDTFSKTKVGKSRKGGTTNQVKSTRRTIFNRCAPRSLKHAALGDTPASLSPSFVTHTKK